MIINLKILTDQFSNYQTFENRLISKAKLDFFKY